MSSERITLTAQNCEQIKSMTAKLIDLLNGDSEGVDQKLWLVVMMLVIIHHITDEEGINLICNDFRALYEITKTAERDYEKPIP